MRRALAVGFGVSGILSWYMPGFGGLFATPAAVTPGEGQIVGAVLVVGAALLWFLPEQS